MLYKAEIFSKFKNILTFSLPFISMRISLCTSLHYFLGKSIRLL